MGKAEREKGKRGEREVAKILREHGFTDARRTQQFAGRTGDSSDVVGLEGFHIEVKRQEKAAIYEWRAQARRDCGPDTPIVVFRRSGDPWMVLIDLEDFLEVIK